MKKIGLIGGMSYESTATYYNLINRQINERLGGLNSTEILLTSVNFEPIEQCQRDGRWQEAGEILAKHARILEAGGCELILICTNTMHKVYDIIATSVSVPVLHIAKATLDVLKMANVSCVGLLGTAYTVRENFYKNVIIDGGVNILTPSDSDIKLVNDVIFSELCKGKILPSSREKFYRIIDEFATRGAQGVILGCTEIGLLISQNNSKIKLFDTTLIHIDEAVKMALM